MGGTEGIGQGFNLAQKRLGPGRIHHAMRWLGQGQRAFDMMCERAVSRYTHGSTLAEKQMIQDWVAESATEMQAARLLTLQAAWKMDTEGASQARVEIAMIKFWGARALYNVIDRAIQVHGSLGYTTDLPLEFMYRMARAARIYDGPDEVHKVTIARQMLKRYEPHDVPSEHVPTRRRGRGGEVRRLPGRRQPEQLSRSPSDDRPRPATWWWRRERAHVQAVDLVDLAVKVPCASTPEFAVQSAVWPASTLGRTVAAGGDLVAVLPEADGDRVDARLRAVVRHRARRLHVAGRVGGAGHVVGRDVLLGWMLRR